MKDVADFVSRSLKSAQGAKFEAGQSFGVIHTGSDQVFGGVTNQAGTTGGSSIVHGTFYDKKGK